MILVFPFVELKKQTYFTTSYPIRGNPIPARLPQNQTNTRQLHIFFVFNEPF